MTHVDLPEQEDDADYIDYLGIVDDWLRLTPPDAPSGFRRIQCDADQPHHPLYEVDDGNVFYDGPCWQCIASEDRREMDRLRCKLKHRRWKSWRILGWLNRKAYTLGLIAGGGTWHGRCEHCGIERQQLSPRWRGRRPYVLGVSRDEWSCLRRGHRRRELATCRALCAICCPCPDCGSDDAAHPYPCTNERK